MIEANTAALFITNRTFLTGTGGVQWCTKEYIETLRLAGFCLQLVAYSPDRSWSARVSRRLQPRPFSHVLPGELVKRAEHAARSQSCRWIFLNNTEALPLASILQARLPDAKFIFLSHGAEITDVVNNLRFASNMMPRVQKRQRWLGQLLKEELRLRTAIHGSVCISATDLQTEQWLGSPKGVFVPRQIPRFPITLAPIVGRVGCVATLNHGPNFHGLELFLKALGKDSNLSVRLVGGPEEIGEHLRNAHRCVEYLGPLDDAALMEEAKTWTSFVNPIFCRARGASTKVAAALGWGLPVLTTPEGARGYAWDHTALPLAQTPEELAVLVNEVSHSDASTWRGRVERIVNQAPSLAHAGKMLRNFVSSL